MLPGEGNVGVAIRRLRSVLGENPFAVSGVLRQRLENLESDYQRMCDFMLNGYRDDQRDEVYKQLLRRMAQLLGDVGLVGFELKAVTSPTKIGRMMVLGRDLTVGTCLEIRPCTGRGCTQLRHLAEPIQIAVVGTSRAMTREDI